MKKPRLGQNYLIDENIACEIIRHAGLSNDQHVLEIGPGKGILTTLLLENSMSLTAIEIDPKLCLALIDRFNVHENFELIKTDISGLDSNTACSVIYIILATISVFK